MQPRKIKLVFEIEAVISEQEDKFVIEFPDFLDGRDLGIRI